MNKIFSYSRIPIGVATILLGILFLWNTVEHLFLTNNNSNFIFIVVGVFSLVASTLFLLKKKIGWVLEFVLLTYGTLSITIFTLKEIISDTQAMLIPFICILIGFIYSLTAILSAPIRATYSIKKDSIVLGIVATMSIIVLLIIRDFIILFNA